MARLYAGTHPFFSWDRYHKLREVFPLSEKQPLRRMSKGMQKQAAFWLTMSCMPEVLVLDEPVDGLDPVMRRQVWSLLLGDVADRGTTVLVSSHNLRELEDVCDHVGILNKGKVLLERSLSDLQDNTVKIQAAYAAAEEPALPRSWRCCTGPPWEGCIPTSSGASGRTSCTGCRPCRPCCWRPFP